MELNQNVILRNARKYLTQNTLNLATIAHFISLCHWVWYHWKSKYPKLIYIQSYPPPPYYTSIRLVCEVDTQKPSVIAILSSLWARTRHTNSVYSRVASVRLRHSNAYAKSHRSLMLPFCFGFRSRICIFQIQDAKLRFSKAFHTNYVTTCLLCLNHIL